MQAGLMAIWAMIEKLTPASQEAPLILELGSTPGASTAGPHKQRLKPPIISQGNDWATK